MTQDAPVSHLLLHPGRNINQPVAFVPGVSCSSPLTLCHTSMWLTVYSFRCMAFLISPCFHPLPPPFAYSHLDLPVSLLADQMHPEWNRPARRERGGGEWEKEVIVGDYSNLFLTSARSLGFAVIKPILMVSYLKAGKLMKVTMWPFQPAHMDCCCA